MRYVAQIRDIIDVSLLHCVKSYLVYQKVFLFFLVVFVLCVQYNNDDGKENNSNNNDNAVVSGLV